VNIRALFVVIALLPLGAGEPKIHSRVPKPKVPELTTTASGLKYADMRVGKGEAPKMGQTCAMLYQGWLFENNKRGKLFDQCQTRKKPFEFSIGLHRVIKGWDEGVASMLPGGKRLLIIPSDLAYGEKGAGDVIPPNATLLFEVELLSVKGEPAAKEEVK
jgi:peptidylprolyl isomerase